MKPGLAFAVAAALAGADAPAHEGHDHSRAPAQQSQQVAPRAEGASPEFEVVAVLQDRRLIVYLDRYDSNQPVADATVEVDSDAWSAVAKPIAGGVYVVESVPFEAPGVVPLVFTVRVGEAADLLHALLELSAPAAAPSHALAGRAGRLAEWAHGRIALAGWSGGALALAGIAAAGWFWRRRNPARART